MDKFASFGEGIVPKKKNDGDMLIPAPNKKKGRRKKPLPNKEIMDGTKV